MSKCIYWVGLGQHRLNLLGTIQHIFIDLPTSRKMKKLEQILILINTSFFPGVKKPIFEVAAFFTWL